MIEEGEDQDLQVEEVQLEIKEDQDPILEIEVEKDIGEFCTLNLAYSIFLLPDEFMITTGQGRGHEIEENVRRKEKD